MRYKLDKGFGMFLAFFVLVFFTFAYIISINYNQQHIDIVHQGQLTLDPLDDNEIIDLDGEWEFYPEVFIDPNEDFSNYEDQVLYMDVPRVRNEITQDDSYQYGTFRIVIDVEDDSYAFKFKMVRLSYEVFVNGHRSATHGVVSDTALGTVSDSQYKLAVGDSVDGRIELVMHVSNYNFTHGGIFSSVAFGKAEKILQVDLLAKLVEFGFSIALFTLGVYYFVLYKKRKDASFLRSFGFMSISASFILFFMSEQVLRVLIPIDYSLRFSFQAIAFILFVISTHAFVSELFKQYANRKITQRVNLFLSTAMIVSFFVQIPDNETWSFYMIIVYTVAVLIASGHILYVMFQAYRDKVRGYTTSTFLSLTLVTFFLVIIAKTLYNLELGMIQQILFSIVIMSSLLLISEIYRYDYEYAVELDRILVVSEEKRKGFIKSLINNVMIPLEDRLKDMEGLMADETVHLNAEGLSKYRFIKNQTQEIVYMLQDIEKSFSMVGDNNYQFSDTNMKQLVSESMNRFIVSNDLENVSIVNSFDIDVYAKVDPSNFSLALYHVLRNALDSVSNHGSIIVSGAIIDNIVFVYVDDDGVGIDSVHLPYVFDSFYKVDQENLSRFGLGLTISKNILESHSGMITIQSTVGSGTRVSMGVPMIEKSDSKQLEATLDEIELLPFDSEFNLMLVSKDPLLIENLKKRFPEIKLWDYQKQTQEKLAKEVLNQSIDVLVLDYSNPFLLQDQVSKHIRHDIDMLNTQILMIAPQHMILDMWFHQQIDVNDFIASPVDYRNLILKINNLYKSKKAIESGVEKEFRYLHSQISPHFLYNTLNTIIGMSYTDPKKTREALYNLSIYLRAKLDVFNADIFESIQTELEIIQSYLNIEKLRYGDHVEIKMDLDESLDFKVPSLMIQNIVENTFKHAFNLNEPNNILSIKIYAKDHKNYIEIKDNGKGMDEETIHTIYSKKTHGFGYRNTFQRLALMQGSQIKIDSKVNEGTCIEIILPEVRT